MQLKQLFGDERGVDPVVGVILMVALTVILAATVGTFVLGLWDEKQPTAPQVKFSFEYDEATDELTVTHQVGDPVPQTELFVRGDVTTPGLWAGEVTGANNQIVASDDYTVTVTGSDPTVQVIWKSTSDNGDGQSAILGTWSHTS